jgi:hypothetical protein
MVTGSDVGDARTGRVDGSGHVQADAAGQVAGEQRPVGRVQPDGVNGDADSSRAGCGHDGVLQAEHVRGLAVSSGR